MTLRGKKKARFHAAIVGGGKVGQVLGRLLIRGGQKVACVISRRSSSARAARRFIGCRSASTSLNDIPGDVNLVLLAVPHGAIVQVAETIAGLGHLQGRRIAVCHTSGMLTAGALDTLAEKGAVTFSFHPLQTFPRDFHPRDILGSVEGITYGVDGSPSAVRTAKLLAGVLRGHTLLVPPHLREFYHAACVVASNHLTALLHVVEMMYGELGNKRSDYLRVFRPIIETTVKNIGRTSPARALSGPVARGGVETVAGHLEAIRRYRPELIPYFVRMTDETVRLALEKGSLTKERALVMRELLRLYEPQLQELT